MLQELIKKKSHPQDQGFSDAEVRRYLSVLDGWHLQDNMIGKEFSFKNYYETLAFVNALAFIVHREDHHPDLVVTYNKCLVRFSTHSVNNGEGGISENDFICAAKINNLIGPKILN